MKMNVGVLADMIEAESSYVTIGVVCEDEATYASTLEKLGVERNDHVDPKSPWTLTMAELGHGRVVVQFESGRPETNDEDSDEEE